MSTVLLLARTLLAVVFLTAGVAKLAKPARTRAMLLSFGVPRGGSLILAWLLPLAELACGVALVPAATAWYGAAAAVAFLVVFLAAIAWNLIRGRRPDCSCFGQLRSAPIGWRVVLRNLGLIVIASFVYGSIGREGDLGLIEWAGRLTTMELMTLAIGAIASLLLAGQTWLIVHLLNQNGRLIHRLDALEMDRSEPRTGFAVNESHPQFGLPVGHDAPVFAGPDLNGAAVSLADLRARSKPVLLFFMDPACGPCATLQPEITRWRRALEDEFTIAVVSRGLQEANREWFRQEEWAAVVLQAGDEIGQLYQALGTPSAVLVDREGRIASPVTQGAGAIRRLVAGVSRTPPERRGRTAPASTAAAAGMALLAILVLGAARHPGERATRVPGADWVLQVRDSIGWHTWWDGDRAPIRWPAPTQAVLDAIWWTPLVDGADRGELVVSSGSLALRTRIVLGRVDSRRYRIRIAGQPTQPGMRPAWTIDAAGEDAVLAFNGGRFGKLGAWGWLVREGRELQPPGWGPLSMAVVLTRDGDTRFASPDELAGLRSSELIWEAIQSYPALLVGDGDVPARLRRPGGSIDLEHRDARLALCNLRDGRLLVALTRFDNLGRVFGGLPIGLTLGEMAAVMGAIGCRQAVSLDGGLSAQMLARPFDRPVERWTGQRAVPLGIEVVPRP